MQDPELAPVEGLASSKVLRVEQRAASAMDVVATVPMNADRQVQHLKRAMHDILKIVRESEDGVQSH